MSVIRWHRAASLVSFAVIWQVAALVAGSRLLPGPVDVTSRMIDELVNGDLLFHLAVTLARVAVSFGIAMLVGGALGIAMGLWRTFDRWADGWVIILLNVPALVTIILSYVWLGLIETAAILAVVLNKVPNVAVTVREGARALDRDYAEMAMIYRFGWLKTLRHVVLPQLAPYLLAASRNGLALIWKIVLVVELLGRSNGVGFQLGLYFQLFDIDSLMAYTLAFVACVLIIEFVMFQNLDRVMGRWRR